MGFNSAFKGLNTSMEHWWNGTDSTQVHRERLVTVRTHVTLKDLTVVLLKIQVFFG